MSEWKETEIGSIPKEWGILKIKDIAQKMADAPFGTSLKNKDYQKDGVVVVQGKNISGRRCNWSDLRFVNIEKYNSLPKSHCFVGDLIFPKVGTIGKVGILTPFQERKDYLLSTNTMMLRVNPEIANQKFVYYYFSDKRIQNYINRLNPNSVQPVFNFTSLKNFLIPIPPISEQRHIAAILSSLDNKIDLLRCQNATLERLAQTLFTRWFVEFEFPNEAGQSYKSSGGAMAASELGEIPAGWKIGRLGEYLDIKHGYAFSGEYIITEETDNILLTPGNFRIGGGFNSSKFKYYNYDEFPEEYLLSEGDLLVTMTDLSKAGDTLGYPALLPNMKDKKLLHNQRLGKVLIADAKLNRYFIYWLMCSREYRWHILGTASGSTVRHTSPTRILDFEFVMPSSEVLGKFGTVSKPLFDKFSINFQQIQTLTRLRDTLLPKLMSGKIRTTGMAYKQE